MGREKVPGLQEEYLLTLPVPLEARLCAGHQGRKPERRAGL